MNHPTVALNQSLWGQKTSLKKKIFTVNILSIGSDRPGQTVQTSVITLADIPESRCCNSIGILMHCYTVSKRFHFKPTTIKYLNCPNFRISVVFSG